MKCTAVEDGAAGAQFRTEFKLEFPWFAERLTFLVPVHGSHKRSSEKNDVRGVSTDSHMRLFSSLPRRTRSTHSKNNQVHSIVLMPYLLLYSTSCKSAVDGHHPSNMAPDGSKCPSICQLWRARTVDVEVEFDDLTDVPHWANDSLHRIVMELQAMATGRQ